jgi:twitching motility protein PilT
MNDTQRKMYEEFLEIDFSFEIDGLARFRVNAFNHNRGAGAVFRTIPSKILSLEQLNAPKIFADLALKPRGMVLVTGPTGSGKSTTLAAMIDKINAETRQHIMTIEDPIEYLHPHKLCLVNQREVHADTHSFTDALRSVLRQDPDIVLIGEMRDLETIEAAMTIAETGHLVFATLHTNTAIGSINRIIDVFPPHQQSQIRAQLSFTLQAVITQTLVPRADGPGRAMIQEIMLPNAAIRNLIREDKVHQIYSVMQTGQGVSGMQTMNQALLAAYTKRQIKLEDALARSPDSAELQSMIEPRAPRTR